MKKIMLTYMLLLTCFVSYGQIQVNNDVDTLSMPYTGAGHSEISQKRAIILRPGFSYKSQTANSLRMYIEPITTPMLRVKIINTDDNSLIKNAGKFTLATRKRAEADSGKGYILENPEYLYSIDDMKILIDSISTTDGIISIYNLGTDPKMEYVVTEAKSPGGDYYSTFYPAPVSPKDGNYMERGAYYKKYTAAEKNAIRNGTRLQLRYKEKLDPFGDQPHIISTPRVTSDANYDAVRIGEYYWMTNNYYSDRFHNTYNSSIYGYFLRGELQERSDQGHLDHYLNGMKLDKSQYQVAPELFNYYYGLYYHRFSAYNPYGQTAYAFDFIARAPAWDALIVVGNIIDRNTGEVQTGWELPSNDDFRQLFAMCPPHGKILDQISVRQALSAKKGANPLAFDIASVPNTEYKESTYWYNNNTDLYGFNMTPGGSRVNGYDTYSIVLVGNELVTWPRIPGDFGQLFHTTSYNTKEGTILLHDYIDFYPTQASTYGHRSNVRYSKKIPDEMLGYKIFYNEAEGKIERKPYANGVPPASPGSGYRELEKGYLRGFYVQYYLDAVGNPVANPKYTIPEIICFSKCVDEKINGKGPGFENPACQSCMAGNTKALFAPQEEISITSLADKITLYPNPSNGIVNIQVDGADMEVYSVDIYTLSGQKVKFEARNPYAMDISHLSSGMYIFRIHTNKGVKIERVIKR